MSSREKMSSYICRTKFGNLDNAGRYSIYLDEFNVLISMIREGLAYEALTLCFEFGRAKGFRMAKNMKKS